MTSKISFPGSPEHLGDGALAEVEAVVGALLDGNEALQAIDGAEYAVVSLISLGGTPGSSGCRAMRILYWLATGMMRSRK